MNIHFTRFFPYRDSINHRAHVISIWDSLEFTQAMRVPCGLNIHHLGVHMLRIHPLWNYSLNVESSIHYRIIHSVWNHPSTMELSIRWGICRPIHALWKPIIPVPSLMHACLNRSVYLIFILFKCPLTLWVRRLILGRIRGVTV